MPDAQQNCSSTMICTLKLLLLIGAVTLIVCQASETSLTRRDRSSFSEIGATSTDSFNVFKESKAIENRSRNLHKLINPSTEDKTSSDLQKTIEEIFITDVNSPRVKVFNKKHGQQPSSDPVNLFKVQRNSAGKLGIVFNENPFLQTLSTKKDLPRETPVNNHDMLTANGGSSKPDPDVDCIDKKNLKLGYCTQVANYPDLSRYEEYLQSQYGSFFGRADIVPPSFSNRMNNNEPEEESICNSKEDVIYPKFLQTTSNDWKLIAQGPKNATQGVRIEECKGKDEQCKYYDSLPIGKQSRCKQFYMLRTLIYVENGKFYSESFKLPSCCKCVVTHNPR